VEVLLKERPPTRRTGTREAHWSWKGAYLKVRVDFNEVAGHL